MFQPVLSISALAEGGHVAVKVESEQGPIEVIICLVEGQFHAIHAQCSHARQSLATGRLRGFEISCPLHGARFDIRTGACTAAPAQRPIASFPVLVEAGRIFIDIN